MSPGEAGSLSDDFRVLGINEVDKQLVPSLPPGWLALLVGNSGSGAPLLAKQFAQAGVGSSPVMFYTTYERTEDVRRAFDDFGWDAEAVKVVNLSDEYYERVLVRGLDVSSARERGLKFDELSSTSVPPGRFVSFNLTNRMLSDLAAIDTPFRLVLDSLDFFLEVLEPREVTTVARQIRHRCQTLGGQALLTLHTLAHERAMTGLLQDLADVVLELRAEPEGSVYQHWLMIQKVGNHPELTRIVRAEFTNSGWTVKG